MKLATSIDDIENVIADIELSLVDAISIMIKSNGAFGKVMATFVSPIIFGLSMVLVGVQRTNLEYRESEVFFFRVVIAVLTIALIVSLLQVIRSNILLKEVAKRKKVYKLSKVVKWGVKQKLIYEPCYYVEYSQKLIGLLELIKRAHRNGYTTCVRYNKLNDSGEVSVIVATPKGLESVRLNVVSTECRDKEREMIVGRSGIYLVIKEEDKDEQTIHDELYISA